MRESPFCTNSLVTSCSTTLEPACAQTCAMPAPIVPAPSTATIGNLFSVMSALLLLLQERVHARLLVLAVEQHGLHAALEADRALLTRPRQRIQRALGAAHREPAVLRDLASERQRAVHHFGIRHDHVR